jgi:hypothetical protein
MLGRLGLAARVGNNIPHARDRSAVVIPYRQGRLRSRSGLFYLFQFEGAGLQVSVGPWIE